ncbi:MAG: leucine-rich repeat domain-containing protein [Rikenellaceae bacterium]
MRKLLCFILILTSVVGYAKKPKKVKMTKEEIAANTVTIDINSLNGNEIPEFSIWMVTGVATSLENVRDALVSAAQQDRTIELTLVNVTEIPDEAFTDCSALTSVSCPSASNVGRNTFANCGGLTNIYLPVAGYIGEGAFSSCALLAELSLPSAMSIKGSAFMYCESLATLVLGTDGGGVADLSQDAFSGFNTESCALTLKSGIVAVEDDTILTIQDSASFTFSSVVIP